MNKAEDAQDIISKRAKKRLKAAFAVLLLGTSVSLITSVFAYNTAASIVRLSDISVSTLLPADIKLGMINKTDTTTVDYYDNLTASTIVDHIDGGSVLSVNGVNTYNYGYTPVSSAFTSRWLQKGIDGTYDALMPKFTTDYATNNFQSSGVDTPCFFPGYADSSAYLSFPIYIKETDQASLPVKIYLSAKSSFEPNTAANIETAANTALGVDEYELDKITGSLRMSVLTSDAYYIVDPYKDTLNPVYLCGRLNMTDDDVYYDTYGKKFKSGAYTKKEALFGEFDETTFDKVVWDSPSSSDSALSGKSTVFNAVTAAGISPLSISKSVANGVKLKEEDSYS